MPLLITGKEQKLDPNDDRPLDDDVKSLRSPGFAQAAIACRNFEFSYILFVFSYSNGQLVITRELRNHLCRNSEMLFLSLRVFIALLRHCTICLCDVKRVRSYKFALQKPEKY